MDRKVFGVLEKDKEALCLQRCEQRRVVRNGARKISRTEMCSVLWVVERLRILFRMRWKTNGIFRAEALHNCT